MRGSVIRRRVLDKISEGTRPGHLTFGDFYNRPGKLSTELTQLINRGALKYGQKGRLVVNIAPTAEISPWYHTRKYPNKQCALWHEIYFRHFDFVPSGCLSCWKVVFVTHKDPAKQTVKDLFRLRDLITFWDVPAKCGCDVRIYTANRYVGFVYSESLDQGKLYWRLISERMLEEFPNSKVILKRGCTEFEHRFGDSSTWDNREDWKALDEYLSYLIEQPDEGHAPGLLEHSDADTFRFWIEYAYSIGDKTWRVALREQGYKVPESLFFKPKTYHEE